MTSLTRKQGKINEKKTINTTVINPLELAFEDQLEVLGFEPRMFSCMKYKAVA